MTMRNFHNKEYCTLPFSCYKKPCSFNNYLPFFPYRNTNIIVTCFLPFGIRDFSNRHNLYDFWHIWYIKARYKKTAYLISGPFNHLFHFEYLSIYAFACSAVN